MLDADIPGPCFVLVESRLHPTIPARLFSHISISSMSEQLILACRTESRRLSLVLLESSIICRVYVVWMAAWVVLFQT